MKTRALYHLLMTSARSARTMVNSVDRARIDAISATLDVGRNNRGPYTLVWQEPAGVGRLEVAPGRFDFYARGDIASIVDRRPSGLDSRGTNWLEAHRVWGQIIGNRSLTGLEATPSRAMPANSKPVDSEIAFLGLLGAGLGLISATAALNATPRALAVPLLGATTAMLGHRVRERPGATAAAVGIGAASASLAAIAVGAEAAAVRSGLAGVAALLCVSELAPARRDQGLGLAVSACGLVGSALATSQAPVPFLSGAISLVGADLVGFWVRREPSRAAAMATTAAAAFGTGLLWRIQRTPSGLGSASATPLLTAAGAVAMLGCATFEATSGVRDRLSGWGAPVAAGLAALYASRTSGISGVIVSAGCGAAAARVLTDRRLARRAEPSHEAPSAKANPSTAKPSAAPVTMSTPTPVSLRIGTRTRRAS